MTPPPWHVTHTAIIEYAFARRWVRSRDEAERDEDVLDRALDALEAAQAAAGYRDSDRYGRELWRSPKRTGGGLRWIIDPRVSHGERPQVIWVGMGAPPARCWAPRA